jgi:hypothetical protein
MDLNILWLAFPRPFRIAIERPWKSCKTWISIYCYRILFLKLISGIFVRSVFSSREFSLKKSDSVVLHRCDEEVGARPKPWPRSQSVLPIIWASCSSEHLPWSRGTPQCRSKTPRAEKRRQVNGGEMHCTDVLTVACKYCTLFPWTRQEEKIDHGRFIIFVSSRSIYRDWFIRHSFILSILAHVTWSVEKWPSTIDVHAPTEKIMWQDARLAQFFQNSTSCAVDSSTSAYTNDEKRPILYYGRLGQFWYR